MLKAILGVLLSVAMLTASQQSVAAVRYKFVAVCASDVTLCKGKLPITFGPYVSLAQCNQARVLIIAGPLGHGTPRYAFSTCVVY